MRLEQMYQEIILDHYRRPIGKGLREPYEVEVHHINPTCGDEVTLRAHIVPGTEPPVVEFSYDGQGCSISQASTSVLFEEFNARQVPEVLAAVAEFVKLMGAGTGEFDGDEDLLGDAIAFAGVAKYPARVKCALLGWMAWKDAVAQAMAERQAS